MTKLKPCPFCGGEAEYSKINTSNTVPFGTVQHFVTCKKNCLEGLYARGNTKEEAIKAWNTRPNPWHTGTPTEEGWYVCFTKDKDIPYQSMKFKEGWWWDFLDMVETKVSLDYVVAWKKIEPYKETD